MAQPDFFLKIDGIAGESQDAKHKGEIPVLSWGWGVTQTGTPGGGGGGGAGKAVASSLHFMASVNKASPVLFLTCATGQHIKSAVLTGRKAGKDQRDYLTVTFSDILVTQYEVNGDESSSSPPVDAVSLSYSKVEYEYKLQNPDGSPGGSVKAGYDFRANKKF